MKKTVIIFIFVLFFQTSLITAGGKEEKKDILTENHEELTLVTPTGFTAISLAELISENRQFADNITLKYEVLESPDLLASKVISGEADLFLAPTILGAKLYNKGIDIRCAGSVIWGILYIVSTENIAGWEDLKGREIAMLGRGLSPDIITRHLLKTNGIDPEKDVKLKYVQNTAELAPAFISGKSSISMMPEPAFSLVRTKLPEAKIIIDIQKEWKKISGTSSSYPQASLFIRGETADKYPAFVNEFIKQYAESIESINSNPGDAGEKAASFLPSPPSKIIADSIPGGNLMWVPAADAKKTVEEYFSVLLKSNPDSIGGSLPDDTFYFQSR